MNFLKLYLNECKKKLIDSNSLSIKFVTLFVII